MNLTLYKMHPIVIENEIADILSRYSLSDILYAVYKLSKNTSYLKKFQIAAIIRLAIVFCNKQELIDRPDVPIRYINRLATAYVLHDPIGFDEKTGSDFHTENPIFFVLRLIANQWMFEETDLNGFARVILLFDKIPKENILPSNIKPFNLNKAIQDEIGCSVFDVAVTAFLLFSMLATRYSVTYNHIESLITNTLSQKESFSVKNALAFFSADHHDLFSTYEKRKAKNRLFCANDFNPILEFPVVKITNPHNRNIHLHSPLPHIIGYKASIGLYYALRNKFGNAFTSYFGWIFEKYVGKIIQVTGKFCRIITEDELLRFIGNNKKSVPDWLIIDNNTLIIADAKASALLLDTKIMANINNTNQSLKNIYKGLRQLQSVSDYITSVGILDAKPKKFILLIITLEEFYQSNTVLFRDHINKTMNQEKPFFMNWVILSVDQLESLQTQLRPDQSISWALEEIMKSGFSIFYNNLVMENKRTFMQSILSPYFDEICNSCITSRCT